MNTRDRKNNSTTNEKEEKNFDYEKQLENTRREGKNSQV